MYQSYLNSQLKIAAPGRVRNRAAPNVSHETHDIISTMSTLSANTFSRIQQIDSDEISVIVERLVEVYHPLRIYLFGSYAWGTPHADSDYDLCVVVEASDEQKRDRSRKGRDVLLDIIRHRGIDLIVYTLSEFERAATHPSSFASPIKSKGVLLYDRIPFLVHVPFHRKEHRSMIEPHDAWMIKAQSDWKAAEVLIRQDEPITDTAIFHTQQCAEKALKGFLAFQRLEIRKTHHLGELVTQCAAIDPTFDSLRADADALTPQATEFRYFDTLEEIEDISQLFPTVERVEEAIVQAKRILEFVKAKIADNPPPT